MTDHTLTPEELAKRHPTLRSTPRPSERTGKPIIGEDGKDYGYEDIEPHSYINGGVIEDE